MLDAKKHLTLNDNIAAQLVGHNHPWLMVQTGQQPFGEALYSGSIAPGLNHDVEHNTNLIEGVRRIAPRRTTGIGVLQPALAQNLVGEGVYVLEDVRVLSALALGKYG